MGRRNLQIATAGELLTASLLESVGLPCHIVRRDGYDLLAEGESRAIRIEVKTACSTGTMQHSSSTYAWFRNGRGKGAVPDIYAFVYWPSRKIIFDTEFKVKTRVFKPQDFTEKREMESLVYALSLFDCAPSRISLQKPGCEPIFAEASRQYQAMTQQSAQTPDKR